ncbi:g4027 [Coccomyxa elongata]
MATVSDPAAPVEIQREPLADITNKTAEPTAEPPRAVRRRINPTPIVEARANDFEPLRQALYFIYTVDEYAIEYQRLC